MSDIGKWVDELMNAGCMPKIAAKVVAEVFAAGIQAGPYRDVAAEKRRAWDREYQAKRRKEKASAESGGNRVEMTPLQALWADGVGFMRQMGVGERDARSNIGKWLKAGNDPARVFELVKRAHHQGSGNPVPYITAGLGDKRNGTGNRSMAAAADDLIARAEERERETRDFPDDIPF